MKPSILILSILLTALIGLSAQEPAGNGLEKLLREALFAEEASQDLTQAAESYEKLLETYRSQRRFAATALFRLAEVRRKQERPKDAAKLYQQLLAEFPTHDPLARLSRENLLALGEALPAAGSMLGLDEEEKEITRLRKIISDSPDLIAALDKEGYAPIHRAAKSGYIRMLEFLLENGVELNHETSQGTALSIAARHGHLKTCQYLIKCGADIERASPFGEAIVSGFQNIGKLLLESGIDMNGIQRMKPRWSMEDSMHGKRIAMLSLAVIRGGHPFVKMLLEAGTDVDFVPEKGESTPLIWAISRNREQIFALLLKHGADANIGLDEHVFPTALHVALANRQGMVFARQLIPRTDLAVRDPYGHTVLHVAISRKAFELVPELVAAGAELDARNEKGETPLFDALQVENWDEAQKLIALGADPEIEVQSKPLIEHMPYNMRVHLMRLRYPEWNEQQAITLCLPQILYHTPLATGAGEPPSLASVLLDWDSPPKSNRPSNQSVDWQHARIFRHTPKEIIDVVFDRASPLPRLEWGDVIEVTTRQWERSGVRRLQSLKSWGYDDRFESLLRFKRSIKITVVVDGKTHQLTLRGDLRVYDPRFQEVPLVGLERLAKLLGIHKGAAVRVERRDQGGFSEVTLKDRGDGIDLEDGDTLTVTRADDEGSDHRITLRSPDLLFGSSLPKEGNPPTLLQFLASRYQPIPSQGLSYHVGQFGSNEAWLWDPEVFAKYEAKRNYALPLALLAFPDWSTLKIRRGESVIEVNLQEAIDACEDATPLKQARAWDQPLRWGDIVEVAAKSADVPWSGFVEETRRLFRKALQREVVLQDASGLIRTVTMQYVPSHYLHWFMGPIPVPSEVMENGRVSVTRADALVQSFFGDKELVYGVQRGDVQLTENPARVWLEDGDQVTAISRGRPRPSAMPPGSNGSSAPGNEGARSGALPPGAGKPGKRPIVRLPGVGIDN